MNRIRVAWLLAFLLTAGVSLEAQAQVCRTCQGASQYFHGRQIMAAKCCPTCAAQGACCCPQCRAVPPGGIQVPMTDVPHAVAPGMPGQPGMPVQPGPGISGVPVQPGQGVPGMQAPGSNVPAPGVGQIDPSAMMGGSALGGSVGTGDLAANQSTGSAPNMIGDFLNGATGSIQYSSRVKLYMDPVSAGGSGSGPFFDSDFINGFDTGSHPVTIPVSGYGELIDGVPGVVAAGTTFGFNGADATPPISSYFVKANASAADVSAAVSSGGTVNAAEPISQAQIVDVAHQTLVAEGISIADDLGELADYVTLTFLSDESTLTFFANGSGGASGYEAAYVWEAAINLPSANPGAFIGRATFTDNNSPLPRDRVFFDYSFFHNARIGPSRIPMNRFVPGFEKTFMNQLMSFELRLPMAVTLNSTLTEGMQDSVLNYEIGDLAMALKGLLYQDRCTVLTAGVGLSVPTADDFRLQLADGTPVLEIQNESVRLMPYVAGLLTPNDCLFLQGFASVDVSASGNPVFYDQSALDNATGGSSNPTGLQNLGRVDSANLLKLDMVGGRWLYRNRCQRRITDLAAVLEAHLATTLNDPDVVRGDGIGIGELSQSSVFNLTAGTHMYFGPSNVVTLGYGFPVTEDRFFDGEFRATFNRYF